MEDSKKHIVILIGPPGSGKDTQADYLAKELGLVHVTTSGLIEKKFKESNSNDPVIKEEKELWTSGELNSREFVLSLVLGKINELYDEGKGIVFSGSPREEKEAEKEIEVLEKLYDRENIKVVEIKLSEAESIKRNSHRRICQANRHPIPDLPEYKDITACPEDGSPIVTRALDNPETIKIRYQVYQSETQPVLDFLRKKEYNILEINGEQPIINVHREILDKIL